MKFFNDKIPGIMPRDPAIARADAGCREAETAVTEALLVLGRTYFEANRDKPDGEYHKQVAQIVAAMDKEKLWRQYRLSLEGQALCEACGTVVTADSLFCKKCGKPMKKWDFTGLGVDVEPAPGEGAVCKACGAPLAPGSAFCEECGAKV